MAATLKRLLHSLIWEHPSQSRDNICDLIPPCDYDSLAIAFLLDQHPTELHTHRLPIAEPNENDLAAFKHSSNRNSDSDSTILRKK